ncbi:MAG: ABC transporter ATP-binding protein [Acetobacteraceae bacterium]
MKRLEMDAVSVDYGEVPGLRDLSLTVDEGEVVALLGANGAGKTTALKAIMGMVRCKSGVIRVGEETLSGLPAHLVARRGIALVPEGRRIFRRMTVHENLQVGGVNQSGASQVRLLGEVYDLFPRLLERRTQLAGTLSGGEQQMLAIGRALMAQPRFILFDEPSLGLAPMVTDMVMATIGRIARDLGIGGILVEQNVAVALAVARRAYVLARGRLALSGPAEHVSESPDLHRAYLGMTMV